MFTSPELTEQHRQRIEQINQEIEEQEALARDYRLWLQDHPAAPQEDKNEIRRRLFNALQKINDLVCKLKPSSPYTIR